MSPTPTCAPLARPQDCLASGKPLLVENIEEELDPVLDPILERRVIRQARGLTLQLADKEARRTLPLLLHCSVCTLLMERVRES